VGVPSSRGFRPLDYIAGQPETDNLNRDDMITPISVMHDGVVRDHEPLDGAKTKQVEA